MRGFDREVVSEYGDALVECGRCFHHSCGLIMGDFSLIPFRRRKHNRGGGFIVEVQECQTDPRQQLGFAILAF